MKNRCVVIGAAIINNYEYIKELITQDDYIIYCDGGLKHLDKLNKKPHLIVGDFDSFTNPNIDVETIVLPREKDDTDSMYAIKEGVKRGFKEFLLIGMIGARLDHTLANVYILLYLDKLNLKGTIVDDYSLIEIVSNDVSYIDDSYEYFSLINISGIAKGVTIKNAKYLLTNDEIDASYQYAVSNEVIPNKVASVEIKEGKLLLIKDRKIRNN